MSNPGPSGGGSSDYLMPTIFLIIGGLVLAWILFAAQLRQFTFSVLRVEAAIIEPFTPAMTDKASGEFHRWRARLANPPKDLPAEKVYAWLEYGGKWLFWPMLLMLVGTGTWVYLRSPMTRYNRSLDLEGLLLENAVTLPRMRPILWLKGKEADKDRGAYTWSLAPFTWACRVGAITKGSAPRDTAASFRADAAAKAFSDQLGALYTGTGALQYHEQLVFAFMAARLMERRPESDRLLDAASVGFRPRMSAATRLLKELTGRQWDWPAAGPFEIVLSSADDAVLGKILRDSESHAEVRALTDRHAHVRVLLAAMMSRAHELQGALTTADLIWVKAVDRTLHYALNDVGRRVASIEASGVRAHLQAERDAGSRIASPTVDSAVRALQTHLTESGWEAPPAIDG